MKNRFLLCCFTTLFLGITSLLVSVRTHAGTPDLTSGSPSSSWIQQIRNNQSTGTINPADVLKARAQREQMNLKSSASLGLNWQFLGPDNVSGRSVTVLFDNQDPNYQTLYTGGVTGGLYKSINMGLSWTPVITGTDQALQVSALAQTPSGTLYVGTGEMSCGAGGSFMGTGLYRSDDGVNFSLVASAKPVSNDPNSDWAFIGKLLYDASASRLFAITNKGIRYSDNGGDSWNILKNGSGNDMEVGSDGTILFSINDSVYMTTNGNPTQATNLSTGLSNTLPNINVGYVELAIAPSDPNIMYASIARASDGYLLNVYRSDDHGANWYVVFPSNPSFEPFYASGCYANTLAVFPNDPDQVVLGGVSCWWGKKGSPNGYFNWEQASVSVAITTIPVSWATPGYHHFYTFRPNDPAHFAMATDNGICIGSLASADSMSFQTTNKNLATGQFKSVAYTVRKQAGMGGGKWIGTQIIGAYQTNTLTEAVQLDLGNGSYCAWSCIAPKTVIYGQEGATEPYVRSDDLGVTPSPTMLGGITSSLANLPLLLWENFDFAYTRDSVKYKATDTTHLAGTTVTVQSANGKFPFEYNLPVTVQWHDSLMVPDPVQSRFFLFGTKGKTGIFMTKQILQFSVDPEWFLIAQTDPITCMTLSSDMNYLYAGTTTGKIYRISNLTLAYNYETADINSPTCIVATEAFSPAALSGRYITSVSFDPTDNSRVLVTLGNYGNDKYVYVTQNALDSLPTFTSVQGNLPAMPVYSSLLEMSGGGKAILGTDMGVYSTDNVFGGGVQWSPDMQGVGDVPVVMLKQQTIDYYPIQNLGAIYAATYGKGLYYDLTYYTPLGTDPGSNGNPGSSNLRAVPNPFSQQVTLTYTLERSGNTNLTVFDLSGRQVYQSNLGVSSQGTHTSTVDLGMLTPGTYVLKVNNDQVKVVKIR